MSTLSRPYSITLLALMFCASGAANAQAKVDRNVVYGMYSGLALLMDVYYPENPSASVPSADRQVRTWKVQSEAISRKARTLRMCFCSFPEAVRGRVSVTTAVLGILNLASRWRQ